MRIATVYSALIIALAPPIMAEITVKWDSEPKNRVVSCPATASETRLTIRVTNVNDVVYAHAVETSVTATDVYPPAPITLNAAGNPQLAAARTQMDVLMGKYRPGFVPDKLQIGKYANLSLSMTSGAWKTVTASPEWMSLPSTLVIVKGIIPGTEDDRQVKDGILADAVKLETARAAIEGPGKKTNVVQTVVDIDWAAKNAISIKVTQTYGGEAVDNGEQTFTCSVDSGAFTLSIGPVFSKIQARQYPPTAVPGGSGTTNVLGVQYASGLRPTGATLVNFAIPKLSSKPWALYLTTGPVVKSSADNTSSFGWFAGTSVALNKLLYLTPGFHFGEFADFPMGYAVGTPIPSGAGTPNPAKRWTWRFAFGISFRVASFAKTEQKTPTPATAEAASQPEKTGSGAAPMKASPAVAPSAGADAPPTSTSQRRAQTTEGN